MSTALVMLAVILPVNSVFANSTLLKQGQRSNEIYSLQQDLKKIGYFNVNPTGYFGTITKAAVINFQKDNNLLVDGIVGSQTSGQIQRLLRNSSEVSRGGSSDDRSESPVELLSWFGNVEYIFSIGATAKITDVDSGAMFYAKRTYGYNHADIEPLTASDSQTILQFTGGWSWTRRAVIVEVNGRRIAGSLAAMPHAGRDDKPANAMVSNRSLGYGYGANLDSVKDNNVSGVLDLHFQGSKTHGSNQVNNAHQQMVQKAYKSGK